MKNFTHALIGLLALLAFAGLTSCKKGTYLVLAFQGAGLPPVNHIGLVLTLADGSVSPDSLPEGFKATTVLKLPASAAFQLDDHSGALAISATAYGDAAETTVLGKVDTSTTIMHGESWTVNIDFSTAGGDAGVDASPADAGDTDSLVTVTDGSIDAGCAAVTVQALESVSLDYNSSGSDMDSGNMLWAYVGPAEQYVGWVKFGLSFVPKNAHLTKATLNLFYSQATGGVPMLQVAYSSVDGWTRKSKASDISNDGVISTGGPYLMPNAAPASTPYALDVTTHDWMMDFVDGDVTLGIENASISSAAITSKIEFYGVNHAASPDMYRPTLDLEFCR